MITNSKWSLLIEDDHVSLASCTCKGMYLLGHAALGFPKLEVLVVDLGAVFSMPGFHFKTFPATVFGVWSFVCNLWLSLCLEFGVAFALFACHLIWSSRYLWVVAVVASLLPL